MGINSGGINGVGNSDGNGDINGDINGDVNCDKNSEGDINGDLNDEGGVFGNGDCDCCSLLLWLSMFFPETNYKYILCH